MYKHAPVDLIASDLVAAALGILHGVCLTSDEVGGELPDSVSAGELIEAGIGFAILSSNEEEKLEGRLQELPRYDHETEDHDTTAVDCPSWTTSGDDPLIYDQAYQADQVRSKGGWSDAVPDPEMDTEPVPGSLRAAREERFERFEKIGRWLRDRKTAQSINRHWGTFRKRYMDGVGAFKASGRDTRLLWLTYDQRTVLEAYKRKRLRQLP